MGSVVAVSSRIGHHFSKMPNLSIRLLKGLGVAGDAHMGETVKHRSRVRKDPTQPNLRQVHLMHAELFDELRSKGFVVQPADLGENVTTSGIDLLALPTGTRLHLGASAVVVRRCDHATMHNPARYLSSRSSSVRSALPLLFSA